MIKGRSLTFLLNSTSGFMTEWVDLVNKPGHPTHTGSLMSARSKCMVSVTSLAQFGSVKTVKVTMSVSEPAAHRNALESNDPVANLSSTPS